jgi:serine protease Do
MRTLRAVIFATGLLAAAPVFAQTAGNTPGGPVEEAPVFARGKPESQSTEFGGNPAGQSGAKSDEEIVALVSKVMPSVVNIAIEAKGQRIALEQSGGDLAYATYVVEYVGAGSIVDPSGLIITNRHVVKDAYEINVTLADGVTFPAQLLGAGSGTDLAILKIDAGRPLPAIEIGNSDDVKVGQKVIAIGNPLGLASTVTAGVVSGIHRNLSTLPQYEFIQTDAAINHGNSGGPLFNMKGQMIGIDNQIWSDSVGGGSIGLGFAIPSNDAQFIFNQVLKYGHPRLGWIGVRVQTVTPKMAEVLQFKEPGGAIIANVADNSPAAEAGLKIGDIVVGIEGKTVNDYRTIDQTVARSVGETIPVRIWSGGKVWVAKVSVREFPDSPWVSYKNDKASPTVVFSKISDAGFEVADLTDELRAKFHLKSQTTGPVVTIVADNTAASQAGLRRGDIIKKVQMDDVGSRAELAQRLKEAQQRGQRNVLLYVGGVGDARWVTVPMLL